MFASYYLIEIMHLTGYITINILFSAGNIYNSINKMYKGLDHIVSFFLLLSSASNIFFASDFTRVTATCHCYVDIFNAYTPWTVVLSPHRRGSSASPFPNIRFQTIATLIIIMAARITSQPQRFLYTTRRLTTSEDKCEGKMNRTRARCAAVIGELPTLRLPLKCVYVYIYISV